MPTPFLRSAIKIIKLDFKLELDASGPGGPWPDLWVEECQLGSFEGYQTFFVNDSNFSGVVPVLGFARILKYIANDFIKNRIGVGYYDDLTSIWKLRFQADGKLVKISDHPDPTGIEYIPIEEFYEAAHQNAEHAFSVCSTLAPSILDNEFVMEWWNNDNYSCATYKPRKTDRRTLTPKHPYYLEN